MALGTRLAYPAPPDLATTVRQRIHCEGRRRRHVVHPDIGPWWRSASMTGAAVVLIIVVTDRFILEVREAVADHIELLGIVIRHLGGLEGVVPPLAAENLLLSERVPLAQARTQAEFELALPTVDGLGLPAFYVKTLPAGIMTTAVYPAGSIFTDTALPGVGALLSQFEGAVAGPMIQKGCISKGQKRGASLEVFSMNGAEAYWIEGPAHEFFFADKSGEVQTDTFRLAKNVLLWQRGTTIQRLELAMTKSEAIVIAESLDAVSSEAGNLRG